MVALYNLLWNQEKWTRYYNCSPYNVTDIPLAERQHVIHALVMIPIVLALEFLCFLTLYAISRPHLIRSPSYKMMFALEVTEMVEIAVVGIVAQLFGATGTVYCSMPMISLTVGTTGLGVWYFEGQMALALAFNRCLMIYDAGRAKRWFDGWLVVMWIGVPIIGEWHLDTTG